MAKSVSQSVTSVAIDTSGLKELASVLRRTDPAIKKEFYKGLRQAGHIVEEVAVFYSRWSGRIPSSLVVRGSGLHVQVAARSSIAPDAAPFEHGGQEGTFRHPVYGNREVWVDQPAHPFLAPALAARIDQVLEVTMGAVDSALLEAGWK